MNALRHRLWVGVQAALFVALVVLGGMLVGCGGGDEDPHEEPVDQHVPTPGPVDCAANPRACA